MANSTIRRPGVARFLAAAVFAIPAFVIGAFLAIATAAAGPPLPRPAAAPAGMAAAVPQADRDLFAMPRIAADLQAIQRRLEDGGDPVAAIAELDRLIARYPTVGALEAARAALALLADAGSDGRAAALDRLGRAVDLGYAALGPLLADPLFAALADPGAPEAGRLAALVAHAAALPAPPPPVPLPMTGGDGGNHAPVEATNTGWDPGTGRLVVRLDPGTLPARLPVLGGQRGDPAYDHLRDLVRRGRAAGNRGDVYDNRDRGHSRLPPGDHPGLAATDYAAAARLADIDYGLADRLVFDRPVLGNSSTAITGGPFWRSLVRDALTRPDGSGPLRLYEGYVANQLYVYPSHLDYGGAAGGGGPGQDLFPANTPYVIVSAGSSRSDLPFLQALAMIYASFRPDTKARLVAEGLLAPTVQYVFRRSQRSVLSREAYMSDAAHPTAFSRYEIGLARMVSLANAITPEAIPPVVAITVRKEPEPEEGVDFFGEGLSEHFFDTPAAIGRIWRGKDYTRRYLVSAVGSRDPNGRPLSFAWRLMRGDPARIRITPQGDGSEAVIEIDWQEPRPIAKENPIVSARVEIGVFANNGVHDSAPAFFSLLLPAHESRRYDPGPDGTMRITSIDHADPAKAGTYADPRLMAHADWRDDYRYDRAGALLGWTRTRPDRAAEAFTPDGIRILEAAAADRPLRGEAVAYPLARDAAGALRVEEVSARPSPAAP